jgi:hypothetical protein
MKIDIFDYFYTLPNFLDLDILGPYSDLTDKLDEENDNCIICYEEVAFENVLKKLNVACDTIVADGELLGLLFKTEQDKLAFILKAS